MTIGPIEKASAQYAAAATETNELIGRVQQAVSDQELFIQCFQNPALASPQKIAELKEKYHATSDRELAEMIQFSLLEMADQVRRRSSENKTLVRKSYRLSSLQMTKSPKSLSQKIQTVQIGEDILERLGQELKQRVEELQQIPTEPEAPDITEQSEAEQGPVDASMEPPSDVDMEDQGATERFQAIEGRDRVPEDPLSLLKETLRSSEDASETGKSPSFLQSLLSKDHALRQRRQALLERSHVEDSSPAISEQDDLMERLNILHEQTAMEKDITAAFESEIASLTPEESDTLLALGGEYLEAHKDFLRFFPLQKFLAFSSKVLDKLNPSIFSDVGFEICDRIEPKVWNEFTDEMFELITGDFLKKLGPEFVGRFTKTAFEHMFDPSISRESKVSVFQASSQESVRALFASLPDRIAQRASEGIRSEPNKEAQKRASFVKGVCIQGGVFITAGTMLSNAMSSLTVGGTAIAGTVIAQGVKYVGAPDLAGKIASASVFPMTAAFMRAAGLATVGNVVSIVQQAPTWGPTEWTAAGAISLAAGTGVVAFAPAYAGVLGISLAATTAASLLTLPAASTGRSAWPHVKRGASALARGAKSAGKGFQAAGVRLSHGAHRIHWPHGGSFWHAAGLGASDALKRSLSPDKEEEGSPPAKKQRPLPQ